ncbi:MAG TPA: sensor histidine kinase, partial [Flavobacteriales bacterium]|nr:sensor histidine kinase [Flavobacteriales bacterium]
ERFLMNALLNAGRFDEVMRFGEHALAAQQNSGDSTDKARIRYVIARSLIAQKRYNDALPILTMTARTLDESGSAEERMNLAMDRFRVFMGIGKVKEAEVFLASAEQMEREGANMESELELAELRYQLAASKRDWQKAFSELASLRALEDSTRLKNQDLAIAGMQVMYELDSKEKDNTALRDLNTMNEETIAEQRSNNRWLLVAAAILLALTAALFVMMRRTVRIARRSKMKNSVIERQKDELHAKHLELQRQNMRLAEAIVSDEQKDIVIKEIHHRVKNNLQVIDSLLNMQCGGTQDVATQRMIKAAQGRIRAMSLVHSAIYRSGGEEAIPVKQHIQELARNVLAAHGKHDTISVQVDAADMYLNALELMPLSLLVNELLTNAIKYAFVQKETGQVRVQLVATDSGLELTFSDNGDALAAESIHTREGSFGMQLIEALAQQLNGSVRLMMGAGSGSTFHFVFAPESWAQRKAS